MVHVVVAVLAVTAHAVQVAEAVEVLDELVHVLIGVEVGGVRLPDALTMGVDDLVRTVDHTHAGELGNRELGDILLAHVPERVALLAEVLETDPHGVVHVLDQVRAPVVEDLQTADLVARVLHVDPAVRHDRRIAEGGDAGGVLELQVLDQQAHGHEIAVRQAVGHLGHIGRGGLGINGLGIGAGRVDGVDQVLDRHRGDELVAGKLGAVALGILVHHGRHGTIGLADLDHPGVGQHLDAGGLAIGLDGLPQLAGTVLRIPELLDQRGLDLRVGALLGQQLLEGVLEHAHDGQALDALGAPVGGDLGGVAAPQLLRVALEEHRIQLAAETVDVEVLQIVFRQLVEHGLQVAEAGHHGELEAHGLQRVGAQRNRVIEEVAVPEDTGHSVALEHHLVGGFGVGTARLHVVLTTEFLVVIAGGALQRQHVLPPVHDPVVLGEEAVTADIHAVAVVLDGTRNAAELLRFFEYGHIVCVGAAVVDELPCCGQASRAAADDHHGLLLRHVRSPYR